MRFSNPLKAVEFDVYLNLVSELEGPFEKNQISAIQDMASRFSIGRAPVSIPDLPTEVYFTMRVQATLKPIDPKYKHTVIVPPSVLQTIYENEIVINRICQTQPVLEKRAGDEEKFLEGMIEDIFRSSAESIGGGVRVGTVELKPICGFAGYQLDDKTLVGMMRDYYNRPVE